MRKLTTKVADGLLDVECIANFVVLGIFCSWLAVLGCWGFDTFNGQDV